MKKLNSFTRVIEKIVREQGVAEKYEVNVFLATEEEMLELDKKWMAPLRQKASEGYGEYHDVLSFPLGKDTNYPDGVTRLGDIVICDQEKEIESLVEHGCLHLLGIHHE